MTKYLGLRMSLDCCGLFWNIATLDNGDSEKGEPGALTPGKCVLFYHYITAICHH